MNVIKNIFGLLLLAVPIFLLERFIPAVVTEILWVSLLLASATYFYVENQKTTSSFSFGIRSLLIFLMMFYGAQKAYHLIHPETAIAQAEHSENTFIKVVSLSGTYNPRRGNVVVGEVEIITARNQNLQRCS